MPSFYKISNNRVWDINNAKFVNQPLNEYDVVTLYINGVIAGEDYLRRTLEFYGYTVGSELLSLEELKQNKINQIDKETSDSILAGFNYTINDQEYHFSYDLLDQQNFADTANMCQLALSGVEGLPSTVTWNSYLEDGTLVQQEFDVQNFLKLYTAGAMIHKATKMEIGGQRKIKVAEAQSEEALDNI